MNIHPTAVIDETVELAADVRIGAYAVISGKVRIDEGSIIEPHAVICGNTTIGKRNHFYSFSSIGAAPQDKKYAGEETLVEIGDDNTFRENVTINRGTVQDLGKTIIGSDNWIMAGVHIAHDCVIGDHCILANASALAGHVVVQDWAILGGYTLVHQFCNIGSHSFCGMGSVINQDVPNFIMVSGNLASPHGLNVNGLKRRGFDKVQIDIIKKSYRMLYRTGNRLEQAISEIEALNDQNETLKPLLNFLKASKASSRGIVR